jgi:hypothetical protein
MDRPRYNGLLLAVTRIHKEFPQFILYASDIDLYRC